MTTINVKAVEAINKANNKVEIPAEEAEALISALDACTKGEQQLLPHVILRGLQATPAAIANNEALAGKALLALVNTLASPQSNDPIRQGAIEGLTGVCLKSTTKQVDVTREVTDVLLQVSLPTSGFSESIRKLAKEQVTKQLIEACPKGVVGKMLHWLSDDREDDEASQIDAERKLALQILQLPAFSQPPVLTQIQQDEQIPKIAARVLSVVSASQFYRLLPIITNFISTSESSATAVVEACVGPKCDSEKQWESLAVLTRVLPKGLKTDGPFEKISAIVSKKGAFDGEAQSVTRMMKAFVAACQLASNETASKKNSVAKDVLSKILSHKDLSNNYTVIEAGILALAALMRDGDENVKSHVDDALASTLSTRIESEFAPLFDKYVYAVKKEGRENAKLHYHQAITCLENLKTIGAKLAQKHAVSQSGIVPSWLSTKKSLPVVASGAKGAFQRAIETAAAAASSGVIRQRGQ